jgi:hypothetical protein
MANIKISELPAAASVATTDVLVVNQGVNTRKATVSQALVGVLTTSQIAGLATTAPAALATAPVVGLSTYAARADHQHLRPSLADLGAQAALTTSAPLALSLGGTGQITRQAAMDALAGSVTAGQYLRGDGTDVVMSTLQAADLTGTVAIANGGTGATAAQAAISNLGIGMRMVEAQTTANIVGTMATGPDPDTFTVTATGVFATDGYTPVLGDIIAFALQTTTTQNGFWELTTLGTASVSAVFTRPSWYTGVVRNTMYMTRFGSAQNGFVQTFVGPTGTGNTEITVGTTNITMIRVNLRSSPASLSSNVFTGPQTLRANGSGSQNCPLIFQSGVALMGTPVGNAVEWFGDQMYLTTAAGVRTTNTTHVAIPATSTSAGLVGQVAVDNANNWLYVCTAANVWKRAALTTF